MEELVGTDTWPKRQGAISALAQPSTATCQEFTDTFIAISRAAGIPSRRITGYAYTKNEALRPTNLGEDILHAWPEYYDHESKIWKQIDPTWEKTTGGTDYFSQFDLNHLTFAINGQSSTTPFPAGAYKFEAESNDVSVTFAEQPNWPMEPELYVQITPKKILGLAIPGRYQLQLQNGQGLAWYNLQLKLGAPSSEVTLSPMETQLPYLLPFQVSETDLAVYTYDWYYSENMVVPAILTVNDTTYDLGPLTITAAPRSWAYLTHPFGLAALGASCLGLTIAAGSVLVFRRRSARSVRR